MLEPLSLKLVVRIVRIGRVRTAGMRIMRSIIRRRRNKLPVLEEVVGKEWKDVEE